MNRFLLGSAFAALALATPVAASGAAASRARSSPWSTATGSPRTCTQCVAATAQLNAQGTAYQARENQLLTPLRAEGQAIQSAVNAIPQGGQPDAALAARIQTFQTNSQAAERELAPGAEHDPAQPAVRRPADRRADEPADRPGHPRARRQSGRSTCRPTLATNPALDVTDAVLALINQNNTPFNVVAPPPAAAGRPAAGRASGRRRSRSRTGRVRRAADGRSGERRQRPRST